MPDGRSARRPAVGRAAIAAGVAGAAAVLLLLAAGWWAWQAGREPDMWQNRQAELASLEISEREQLADQLFNRVSSWLSDADGAGAVGEAEASANPNRTREITMHWVELNAWLEQRMDGWLEQQGIERPAWGRSLTVGERDGRLAIAFRAGRAGESGPIVTLIGRAVPRSGGRLRIKLDRLKLGRAPLPRRATLRQLARRSDADDAATAWLEAIENGLELDPVLDVDASRRTRITDIAVHGHGLEITARTERRER